MKTPPFTSLTSKQIEIIRVIVAGNGISNDVFVPIDFDQLLERLSYKPTKNAAHFSIRPLILKKMILKNGVEKRRGRNRITFIATEEGKFCVTPASHSAASFPEIKIEDELEIGLEAISVTTDFEKIEDLKIDSDLNFNPDLLDINLPHLYTKD